MNLASRRTRIASIVGATALLLSVATSAHAQTAADRENARALFDDGKKKRDAGNVAGALESFKGADAIMHAPTTGLAVARSLAALGRLIEAREAALQIEDLPPTAPKEPAAFRDARRSARDLAADLAARIPSITVVIKGASGGTEPTLTIDGSTLPAAVMKAPRRLDPGKHVIVASIQGREVREETTLAERDAKTVELDVTELVHARAAPKDVPPAAAASPALTKGSYSPLLWVGVGVAVAGAAAGTVTGLVSMGKTSDVKNGCTADNKCPPSTHDALDGARLFATLSTISFVAAGAGAGVAVVALAMGRGAPVEQKAAARITPWVGVGSAGLSGTF